MPTDGIGHEGMGSQTADRLKVEVEHVAGVSFWMNDEFTDGNSCSTTLGTKLIEALRARAWTAVSGNVCRTHRRRENTVTESHLAQLDGACLPSLWQYDILYIVSLLE
jgi:hypothetical protein